MGKLSFNLQKSRNNEIYSILLKILAGILITAAIAAAVTISIMATPVTLPTIALNVFLVLSNLVLFTMLLKNIKGLVFGNEQPEPVQVLVINEDNSNESEPSAEPQLEQPLQHKGTRFFDQTAKKSSSSHAPEVSGEEHQHSPS